MKVYVLLMVVAGALTVLLTPLVRWACLRWGIVPKLRSRDIQSTPIPRLGGIAITIALVNSLYGASLRNECCLGCCRGSTRNVHSRRR